MLPELVGSWALPNASVCCFLEEHTGQDFGSDLDADEMLALSLWPASG